MYMYVASMVNGIYTWTVQYQNTDADLSLERLGLHLIKITGVESVHVQ